MISRTKKKDEQEKEDNAMQVAHMWTKNRRSAWIFNWETSERALGDATSVEYAAKRRDAPAATIGNKQKQLAPRYTRNPAGAR